MNYADSIRKNGEYTEFNNNCIELLHNAPARHSKFCFLSSLMHLEKAYKLETIDKEMAIFRAITAEEEAATGLMMCLKELNYKNAEKLRTRDHVCKNAISAFLVTIINDINEVAHANFDSLLMRVDRSDKSPSLKLGIPLSRFGQSLIAWPVPPLNVHAKKNGLKFSYKNQLRELINKKGKRDVISYIKELANERNKLLYASPKGVAQATDNALNYINLKEQRVIFLLRAYLLIFPYKEKQQMVQDSIDAFLAMLGTISYEGFSDT
ncbi:hypothetical protein DFO54_1167 [Erwinia sp. AG740]|nr:hypothetical protein DFO54_1167 [Erwinia sp. AG740]